MLLILNFPGEASFLTGSQSQGNEKSHGPSTHSVLGKQAASREAVSMVVSQLSGAGASLTNDLVGVLLRRCSCQARLVLLMNLLLCFSLSVGTGAIDLCAAPAESCCVRRYAGAKPFHLAAAA